jgi:hypothetical protein
MIFIFKYTHTDLRRIKERFPKIICNNNIKNKIYEDDEIKQKFINYKCIYLLISYLN